MVTVPVSYKTLAMSLMSWPICVSKHKLHKYDTMPLTSIYYITGITTILF